MKPWGEQVDELIEASSYADALTLLENIDHLLLPDKVRDKHKYGGNGLILGFMSDFENTCSSLFERCYPVSLCAIRRCD